MQHILTLICLMLRRDLELFHLATKVRVHEDEFWDATDSLVWVYDAVQMRYSDLIGEQIFFLLYLRIFSSLRSAISAAEAGCRQADENHLLRTCK
jgi:hypothetical protein